MFQKYKKYLFYTLFFVFMLYAFLYTIILIVTPPQHFAISKILSGRLKIKEVGIGIFRMNSEEDCSIFQKSLVNGYRGRLESLNKPYRVLGGNIMTNEDLNLNTRFFVFNEKNNTIGISFDDMENEYYIVELPQSIADSLYDKIN